MAQSIFFVLANALAICRFYLDKQYSFLTFFGLCIGILTFFSIFISKLQKKGHKSAHELMARTLTFWWMLSLFAIALLLPPIVFTALLGIGSLLAIAEYQTLLFPNEKSLGKILRDKHFLILAIGCVVNYVFLSNGQDDFFAAFSLIFMGIVLPIFFVLQGFNSNAQHLSSMTLNFVFFGALLPLGLRLYSLSIPAFLLVVFLTEIRDLVSYWLGKFFAKVSSSNKSLQCLFHAKISASVSPNKTWWVGVVSTLLMVPLGSFMNNYVFNFDNHSDGKLISIYLMIGVLGLFGDLVFSLVKRIYGQKDSGTWLPGGSGIIDRIDALVFTLPTAFFILKFF